MVDVFRVELTVFLIIGFTGIADTFMTADTAPGHCTVASNTQIKKVSGK